MDTSTHPHAPTYRSTPTNGSTPTDRSIPTDHATPTLPLMRASDADRMATVLTLQEAVVRGLLTPAEGDERSAAAFATTHRHELAPLTADLPPASPVTPNKDNPPRSTRWSGSSKAILTCWLILLSAVARLPRGARIAAGLLLGLLLFAGLFGFGFGDHGGGDGFRDAGLRGPRG